MRASAAGVGAGGCRNVGVFGSECRQHAYSRRTEMSSAQRRLPQLDGGWFLTDGGIETVLIYQ
ncbi:MAG: hypothetical protein ABW005_15400, partial [Burkholderiaceae bacterium]